MGAANFAGGWVLSSLVLGAVTSMLANPKECRVHARRCAEWAAGTKNPELQRKLSDLARTWNQLAIQLEEAHALLVLLRHNICRLRLA